MGPEFPPATGVRTAWGELPEPIRSAVETLVGATVVEARSQPGGFSPGVAARLRLADGRRAFVKAVSEATNPESPELHRREARVSEALPEAAPAPRLLGVIDTGGWVALVYEDVEGRQPHVPWRQDELRLVLDAITQLAATLTPTPIELESLAVAHGDDFDGLRCLRELRRAGDSLGDLDPWLVRNVDRLAEAEAGWERLAAGDTLLHVDLRADNLRLTPDGRVLVVDWPHAAVGAAWVDLLCMLPSVAMQGGPEPWEVFDDHPVARRADPEAVTAMLCGLTGLFVANGREPDPPGLPTLRRFQLAQGEAATRWLRRRTGWE
jgi:aminoglycoside phosphotransferase (APT) family kinase protein